jgi:hypothetical protein
MVITSFHSEEKWSRGDLEPDYLDEEYIPKIFENVSQKIGELQEKAEKEVREFLAAAAAAMPPAETESAMVEEGS